jgi:hypothetical protein
MILPVSSNYGVSSRTAAGPASLPGGEALTGSRSRASFEGLDVIEFSNRGALLAAEPLLLPTASNVRKLSAALSDELGRVFRSAGIEPEPPVEFEVEAWDGSLWVKGDRPDAGQIADLVNADPELKRQLQTVAAISSHACQMEEQLSFQREYRGSNNPEAVVAKYYYLFGASKTPAVSLRFDGQALEVLIDNETWPPSDQG